MVLPLLLVLPPARSPGAHYRTFHFAQPIFAAQCLMISSGFSPKIREKNCAQEYNQSDDIRDERKEVVALDGATARGLRRAPLAGIRESVR